MQGIYAYIPETNYVPREYSVATILLLLFMVLISIVPVLNLLHFYISTFRSMCAVPNMAVFWSSLTSCFLVCCSRIFWTTLKLLLLLLLLYYYLSLLWWIYPIIWAYVKENLFPVHIRLQLFCSSVYGTCNIISHNKTFTLVLSGVRAQCPIWRYFFFPHGATALSMPVPYQEGFTITFS